MITINVLGELTVLRDGEALALPPSRKTRALLGYLAVCGRPQRRERLCEIFWDVPDDPRGALRWSLSKLRKAFTCRDDSLIEADRNAISLRREVFLLDLDLLAGLSAATLQTCDLAGLEAAAAAFRGEFLEDLSLDRCPNFEAWRRANADEFELLQAGILGALVERLSGEPARALHYAHKLIQLRPDDEELAARIKALGEEARRSGSPASGPAGEQCGEAMPAGRSQTREPEDTAPRTVLVGPDDRSQEIRACMTPDGVRVA